MEPSPKFVYRLTSSQRMALLSLITEYIQLPDQVQVFVDVLTDTETTAPDLLNLFVMQTELESGPAQDSFLQVLKALEGKTAAQLRAVSEAIRAIAAQLPAPADDDN